jgi:hypothetical protein
MEITYDALMRAIRKEIEAITNVKYNKQLVDNANNPEATKEYCKELVRKELYKEFLNGLDRVERATKGKLHQKIKEAAETKNYVGSKNQNNDNSKVDTKNISVKIADLENEDKEEIEEENTEDKKKTSQSEITATRDGLFPGWKDFRQQSKMIYSTNESKSKSYKQILEGWNKYIEDIQHQNKTQL